MTAYIRMLKPLDTSRRIWAVLPSPVLTLRLSTLKTFCNCKTYGAPNISIVLQYPHPQAVGSGNNIRTEDLPGNEAIDPAILSDHDCHDSEYIQATENIIGIATHLDECPSNCFRFPDQDLSFQRRRHNLKKTVYHDRQSKVKKCSRTGKRHTNNGSCWSTRGPGHGK
ncbi:uncharacterized protein N7515_000087, partial [Penicillium bovifimosum]